MLKCEYQRVKRTSSRKHLNQIVSQSQFISRLQIFMVKTLLPKKNHNLTSEGKWSKERNDNKNVKNTIGLQHENRESIFTDVGRIDSILNRNCFTSFRVAALSGLASTGVQKIIGNGLYFKKAGSVC